ncbi:uncharacterized protein LOC6559906 isoform X2 [Drosophila grimshawi]|uniref:GH21067 n=1 Tax=Drosophila grimshawi TaxID=7222 RepID=B4J5K0_DROGR|nr:uncharacterized protein LOC6559906 isoform X2 [Drosophila grimshawi]EDW00763.1 GH21067 [Drosophila grimshawi]
MKLFCVVLVVYVVALTLFGVDGRRGGKMRGLEEQESMRLLDRARRHAHGGLKSGSGYVNNEQPPPPPHFRSRRNIMKVNNEPEHGEQHMTNEEPPHFRQRRQLPPGLPMPPEGFPMPRV